MKFMDLFMVNCIKDKDGLDKLLRALCKTEWLKKYEPSEITIELLEKLCRKIEDKYKVKMGYIMRDCGESYSFMIKNENGQWLETVYAYTLFEGMAKVILVFYGYIRKGISFKLEIKE